METESRGPRSRQRAFRVVEPQLEVPANDCRGSEAHTPDLSRTPGSNGQPGDWEGDQDEHDGRKELLPADLQDKDDINQWWYSLYVLDHNYALTQVELRATAEDWVPATRCDTNFWTLESAAGLMPPIDVRITDIHGQVISGEDVVANFNENAVFDVGSQFPGGMGGGGPLGGSW